MTIRERYEEKERRFLGSRAAISADSRGRVIPEELDPIRTAFARDRDRILHCKAFRRLKHKTQVFLATEDDHVRTRLTHTLEVAQIARTIARALELNEDLTEAVALAHDLGHTPFGHAGERALDAALRQYGATSRFRHYEQSLRVVEVLENQGRGLNLTWETRDGIGHHSKGRADVGHGTDHEIPATLEGQCVRLADRIAYIHHDIQDAIRAGLLRETDLPAEVTATFGATGSERLSYVIQDLITTSEDRDRIAFSPATAVLLDRLKDFMFDRVYTREHEKRSGVDVDGIILSLFAHSVDHPETMPQWIRDTARREQGDTRGAVLQAALDNVSGMTDRYALRRFSELSGQPESATMLAAAP